MVDASPFNTLPSTIVTSSILPFIGTDDWMQFRCASRYCYETVHGTADVSHSYCRVCQSSASSRAAGSLTTDVPDNTNEETETLWKIALVREYRFDADGDNLRQSIHSTTDEFGAFLNTTDVFAASSYFMSWKHWRKIDARRGIKQEVSNGALVSYPNTCRCTNLQRQTVGPYYLRAAALWKKVEDWCGEENEVEEDINENELSPTDFLKREIKRSLVDGMDVTRPVHGFDFQDDDKITALSAVYSFYSGQVSIGPILHGMFGGYAAYGKGCVMEWFHWSRRGWSTERYSGFFIIAIDSIRGLHNSIGMDIKSGRLIYGNQQTGQRTPAIKDQNDSEDDLLSWFEEYAKRLSTGYFSIGKLAHNVPSPSLLHFPSEAGGASRAITNGVEVIASSTYHPFANISRQGMHIYSIRMKLLTQDECGYVDEKTRGFSTCQLHSRNWIITKRDPRSGVTYKEEVRGEGVVGEFPLLMEGGFRAYITEDGTVDAITVMDRESFDEVEDEQGTFSYQSCTDMITIAFEGHFNFVPGSLRSPEGPPFRVRVAPFRLCSTPAFFF